LGLIVPEPGLSKLTVNGVDRHWIEGEGFLWDDTFLHEAENLGQSPRVVLFLDIDREMSPHASLLDWAMVGLIKISPQYKAALLKSEPKAIQL
jgi:aspartyl/asparaginyl beta-hydroxylase (cupin superfamily)